MRTAKDPVNLYGGLPITAFRFKSKHPAVCIRMCGKFLPFFLRPFLLQSCALLSLSFFSIVYFISVPNKPPESWF